MKATLQPYFERNYITHDDFKAIAKDVTTRVLPDAASSSAASYAVVRFTLMRLMENVYRPDLRAEIVNAMARNDEEEIAAKASYHVPPPPPAATVAVATTAPIGGGGGVLPPPTASSVPNGRNTEEAASAVLPLPSTIPGSSNTESSGAATPLVSGPPPVAPVAVAQALSGFRKHVQSRLKATVPVAASKALSEPSATSALGTTDTTTTTTTTPLPSASHLAPIDVSAATLPPPTPWSIPDGVKKSIQDEEEGVASSATSFFSGSLFSDVSDFDAAKSARTLPPPANRRHGQSWLLVVTGLTPQFGDVAVPSALDARDGVTRWARDAVAKATSSGVGSDDVEAVRVPMVTLAGQPPAFPGAAVIAIRSLAALKTVAAALVAGHPHLSCTYIYDATLFVDDVVRRVSVEMASELETLSRKRMRDQETPTSPPIATRPFLATTTGSTAEAAAAPPLAPGATAAAALGGTGDSSAANLQPADGFQGPSSREAITSAGSLASRSTAVDDARVTAAQPPQSASKNRPPEPTRGGRGGGRHVAALPAQPSFDLYDDIPCRPALVASAPAGLSPPPQSGGVLGAPPPSRSSYASSSSVGAGDWGANPQGHYHHAYHQGGAPLLQVPQGGFRGPAPPHHQQGQPIYHGAPYYASAGNISHAGYAAVHPQAAAPPASGAPISNGGGLGWAS